MSRLARALAVVLALSAVFAATASAHDGDPRYRSIVNGISPLVKGLSVQVLGYDDQIELDNRTGQTVVVKGYSSEPYARLLSDGTVEVNHNSPAYYLNEDRFAEVQPPKQVAAHPDATPNWIVQDRTGRFVFHDHRMHWMLHTVPKQVTDQSKRTEIFPYKIPMTVGAAPATIDGTLWWIGQSKGFPVAAIVALIVVALAALAAVLLARRRRGRGSGPGAPGSPIPAGPAAAGEAGAKEVW